VTIDWASYLDRYHADHPGITEDVLDCATDDVGRSPYDWLVEPLSVGGGLLLDIGCGSAPLACRAGDGHGYVGLDRSASELRRALAAGPVAVALGDARALPVGDGRADAVVASMMLMVAGDVDAVLAEVGRVLRPGGTFVATVPTLPADDDPSAGVFAEVLAVLGRRHVRYPGSLDPSTLPGRLAAAGLALSEDVRGRFTRHVGAEHCRLVADSFYAVGADDEQLAEARARLRARAATGPFPLTYPLRRLVAVRRSH
jgi:SAM-dependent methyltransferase